MFLRTSGKPLGSVLHSAVPKGAPPAESQEPVKAQAPAPEAAAATDPTPPVEPTSAKPDVQKTAGKGSSTK